MNTIVSLAFLFVLSVYGAQGLSCYCRLARCEDTESLKRRCKGGLVDDVCLCCKTCAKVEGETCGGLWGLDGTCDQGLFCKGSDRLYMMTRGICAQQTPSIKVTTEFPTSWQNILKTTETSYSGDESGDNSESSGEETEKPTQETIELPIVDPIEFPTSWQNILKTTEISYSGDESGDDPESSGEETEKPTSKWSWFASPEREQTQETTELPTVDPTEEEVIVFF